MSIPDVALKAAAHAVTDARRTGAIRGDYETAETVLAAVLASGCVLVELPAPDENDPEGTGYWGDVYTGDFVSSRPPNGDPIDFLHGVNMGHLIRTGGLEPDRAMRVAGWLLAAARHATVDRKAATR